MVRLILPGCPAAAATGEHDFDFSPGTGVLLTSFVLMTPPLNKTRCAKLIEIFQRDDFGFHTAQWTGPPWRGAADPTACGN